MKKCLIGLLLTGGFLFSAAVSFASDGPETEKSGFDIVSDLSINYTAEAVVYSFDSGLTEIVISASDNSDNDFKNNVGLMSVFVWEALQKVPWPLYNEWLEYKYELSFKPLQNTSLHPSNFGTRCNC